MGRKKKEQEEVEQVDISELVSGDDKFKSFKRIVKNVGENINIEKLNAEILRLHAGRKSRTLYLKRPGVDAVVEAVMMDSGYRSRIAEIRVEASYQLGLLEEALDKVRKHFMHEYRESMPNLRTKGERMSFADQFLGKGISLMHKLTRLISTADAIIKDIDQMGFSFKHIVDSMEILYSHKNDKKNI